MAGDVALDTNVVVSHFRDADRFAQAMLNHRLHLPVTVVAELRSGANRSADPERHNRLIDRFLNAVTVLPSDLATAAMYGKIWAALATAGLTIPANDIWIAAAALQHGLPLVTQDAHFSKVPGLAVERW